jgi:hypothetical protein
VETLTKGKKKNKPKAVIADDDGKTPLHHASEAAVEAEKRHFSAAERRRAAKDGAALEDGSFPIYDQEDLDNAVHLVGNSKDPEKARAHIRRRAGELDLTVPDSFKGWNPVRNPYQDSRLSEGLTDGRQSPSSGDHGVGQGRNRAIAAHHPDLRQSNVDFSDVLANLRTCEGDDEWGDRSMIRYAGEVALHSFDAANQAGRYQNMQNVDHSPARPDYHPSQQSATKPNGSHSVHDDVQSNAVSRKGMTPLEIMKACLREQQPSR